MSPWSSAIASGTDGAGTGTAARRATTRRCGPWIGCCSATPVHGCAGDVVEVAIGTGLNLPHYPAAIRLVGIDHSAPMLAIAEQRAAELGVGADLRVGDAEALDVPDGSVDTVVCTFSLCGIPDPHRAGAEMARVLRSGGRLLLADHVASSYAVVRGVQRLAELVSVPAAGEHFRRRPLHEVEAAGLEVTHRERFALGIVERISATKPVARSEVRR